MSKESISDRFKDALGSYSSNLNEDQLWEDIKNRVPRQERKRRIFLWFFFGLMILGSVTGYLLNNKSVHLKDSVANRIENDADIMSLEASSGNCQITGGPFDEKRESYGLLKQRENGKNEHPDILFEVITASNVRSEARFNSDSESDQGDHQDIVEILPMGEEKIINRKHVFLDKPAFLPINKLEEIVSSEEVLLMPVQRRKRRKKAEPVKVSNSFLELNFYTGIPFGREEEAMGDFQKIHYGTPYYARGISLNYSKYFTSNLYGIVSLSGDKIYLKYEDIVQRDTLVPTSAGEQIISYNQLLNGLIDTKSGIPLVKGTVNHDVLNLNAASLISVGLGLGLNKPFGKLNLSIEALVYRSVFYSFSGMGREEGADRILDLENFEDYFARGPYTSMSSQVKLDFALTKSILLTSGLQYQRGLTNILSEQASESNHLSTLRMNVGIKSSF